MFQRLWDDSYSRFRRRLFGLGAAVLLECVGLGCGPSFPPYWQLSSEPSDAGGNIDPNGQLRILALTAEPPEVAPGQSVRIAALVATHPRYGEIGSDGGSPQATLRPRGLSVLYRFCVLDSQLASPLPCGLFPQTQDFVPLPNRTDVPTVLAIPFAQFPVPLAFGNPYQIVVTLIAADSSFEGGANGCAESAAQNGGVSPIPNHCVIAIKRVKVSRSDSPNHNPKLRAVSLGSDDASLVDLATGNATYPKLGSDVADSDRPFFHLVVERSADSEEQEPDPKDQSQTRAELLTTSLFVTSGNVDSGRGNFIDLDCKTDCPQRLQTTYLWQPPALRAMQESPDDRTHFVVVLRDDRGGSDFAIGTAKAR